jgi:acyl dehydratase
MSFDTPLVLSGPARRPRQMLGDQSYGGHASIHDDSMAEKLGFRAGPIEGPTHFSMYGPLLVRLWGQAWFERGCLSAHYQNMVVEGEEVRAFAEMPAEGATRTRVWIEKLDGTPVQEASASLGPDHGTTLLEARMAKLRPPERLVILADLQVGMKGAEEERVRMEADQNMGALYPFSLNEKLAAITEPSPWYSDAAASPWGRPIIPTEMVSVLAQYSSDKARWPVKGPAVGLFADQEIRMIKGPLFVGEEYVLRREVVALSESGRTESMWVRTRIYDRTGTEQVAEMLLNSATLKASYAPYEEERARVA